MTTVSLTNPSLIPMEAVTTMGVSAKEGENPIGVFGTGLKYAIASLIRTGQKVTIWRGMERYDFAAEKGVVRGKEFDFIRMTGPDGSDRLGFTTHLGSHWEMWQVFREIYSNCLDEAGDMAFARVDPAEGHTTIWVTGEQFAEAAREKGKVFLSTKPLFKGTIADVHPGACAGVYYRGVLAAKLDQPSAFTYNITSSMTLTEDRTLKDLWSVKSYVSHTLMNCDDAEILGRALTSRGMFEEYLGYTEPCEAFAEIALALCEKKGRGAVVPSAAASAERWAQRQARVSAINLSDIEQAEVDEALLFLGRMGYPVSAPIVVAETLGPGVAGMAKHETIYLSRTAINRGGNYLIGTILEEHLHLTQGFDDESRGFQDFLIDLVVKLAKHSDRKGLARPPVGIRRIARGALPAVAPAMADLDIPF